MGRCGISRANPHKKMHSNFRWNAFSFLIANFYSSAHFQVIVSPWRYWKRNRKTQEGECNHRPPPFILLGFRQVESQITAISRYEITGTRFKMSRSVTSILPPPLPLATTLFFLCAPVNNFLYCIKICEPVPQQLKWMSRGSRALS